MPVLPSYRNQSIDLHSKSGFYISATLALNHLKPCQTFLNLSQAFVGFIMIELLHMISGIEKKSEDLK